MARDERVRALVRPGSAVEPLRAAGVELLAGDVRDPAALAQLVKGADRVYHCAGKVSDWAPWPVHREQSVAATVELLKICQATGVGRVVCVSSIHVYGRQHASARPVTEDLPLARRGFAVRIA
jgi:nucleoside-diphosphate-sugar epimerase